MADDYTPTPEEARDWFIIGVHHAGDGARYPDTGEAFDRMIAAVEAKAYAKVIDRLEAIYGKVYMADEMREHFGIEAG